MLVTAHLLDKICSPKESANRSVLEGVLTLALEIAHEGRGGKKVGTIFMAFDSKEVLKRSQCLIYDPLLGHPEPPEGHRQRQYAGDRQRVGPAGRRLHCLQ